MDLLLSNKVVIVTGTSRGIGKAIAETLSVEGMRDILVARSRVRLHFLPPPRLPAKASRARSWMWMAAQPGRYNFWEWQYNSTTGALESKVFAKHPPGLTLVPRMKAMAGVVGLRSHLNISQ